MRPNLGGVQSLGLELNATTSSGYLTIRLWAEMRRILQCPAQ